ncbi:hypothetical protein Ddye_010019 [Dipteronia dyeriana]|uniref:SWIM-type domain-containing protein n=1 Tax=Dipteronia dyeriana TaxID=168575 RepID=A0AAE0CMU3_9ROSI|nr:hypothetical protein Ddye_010019 [Dipteronia dyeriana]
MTKEVSGSSELPSRGFTVRVELPWSRDTIVFLTDSELLDVFREFGNRGYDQMRFQIEKTPYSPIGEPEVVEQIGWCNKEAGMFDFTVDSKGDDTESDDAQFEEGVESNGDTGEGVNTGVRVGLYSMEDEGVQTGEGVNNGVGVGLDGMEDEGVQTGEGVQNEGVENGEDVHTGEGLDGDVVNEDEITKQCMALFNGYESSEAKVKWIDSRVESLMESNSTVGAKVLGLDGCHLKGPCGGVLLSAVALDANIGIFPLAICICEKETKWSWKWFLNSLKIFLQFPENKHLCFMSDRQKGLVKALHTHIPLASTSMFGTHIAQTYLQLLEFIRRMVMRKLQERKEECEDWKDVLPPRVNARIPKNSQASRQFTIISVRDQEYELLGPDGTFPVKLKKYCCGCGSWQISGIPCPHAMAAISHSCGRRSLKD